MCDIPEDKLRIIKSWKVADKLLFSCFTDYSWKDDVGFILTKVQGDTHSIFHVRSGVAEIADNCFADNCFGSTFRQVVLPKSVKRIGKSAFEFCDTLERINLENVETIEGWAFMGCARLRDVELPMLKELREFAFQDCYSLEYIEIPSVKKICEFAFDSCRRLRVAKLPEVELIEKHAFSNCNNLGRVEVKNSCAFSRQSFSNTKASIHFVREFIS